MTSLPLAQKEIFEELRYFDAEERRIDTECEQIDGKIATLLARKMELSNEKKGLAENKKASLERLQRMTIEGELSRIPLRFDENKRKIYWEGGESKPLSKTLFRFAKVLYEAPEHRLAWSDIEEKVWGEATDGAIFTAATRLRNTLLEQEFPYRLVTLTRKTWIPEEGYEQDEHCPSPKINSITGYWLE